MGLIVHFFVLALVRALHAVACDTEVGLEQCLAGSEQRRVSSTLLQRETKSASQGSRAVIISPPSPDATGHATEDTRDAHPLMKPPHGHGEQSASVALAMTLIGIVVFLSFGLYLLNFPDKDMRRATWKVLSEALTIFCAVMLFDGYYKLTSLLFHEPVEPTTDDPHNAPPDQKSIYFDWGRLLVAYLAFEGVLYWSKSHSWYTEPFGFVGSHFFGFVIIQLFGDMQQTEPWSASPFGALVLTALAAVALGVLYTISESIRRGHLSSTQPGISRRSKNSNHWRKLCCEFEDEAAGLALGFLLMQTIKFLITGYISPVHGAPKNKTDRQIFMLFCSALCFTFVVAAVARFMHHSKWKTERGRRAAQMLMGVCSMTEGWCLLHWGIWKFWNVTGNKGFNNGDCMTARLLLVGFFGVVGFAAIFVINILTHKGLIIVDVQISLIDSIGLLLGLSWEACINVAMEGVHFKVPGRMFRLYDGLADLSIALIVTPAWAFYILPHALAVLKGDGESESEQDEHKSDDDEATCCCPAS